jgi:hypothetical protein
MTLEPGITNDEDPTTDEDCASDDEGGANDEDSGAELDGNTNNEDDPDAEEGAALLLSGPDDDVTPTLDDPPDTPMEELPGCELDLPTDDDTRLDAAELLDTPLLLPPKELPPPPLEEDPVALPPPAHAVLATHLTARTVRISRTRIRTTATKKRQASRAAQRPHRHRRQQPEGAHPHPPRAHHRLGQCQVPRKTCAVHRAPSGRTFCGAGAVGGFFPAGTLR